MKLDCLALLETDTPRAYSIHFQTPFSQTSTFYRQTLKTIHAIKKTLCFLLGEGEGLWICNSYLVNKLQSPSAPHPKPHQKELK